MIINFYLYGECNCEGVTLEDIYQWSYDQLEHDHSYIQWLFPLDVPSNFNPDAPVLSQDDKILFRYNNELKENMRQSLDLLLGFFGLTFKGKDIVLGENFEKRVNLWKFPNHNWLRITRILKSLRLCGLEEESRAFFSCLVALHSLGYTNNTSFQYWEDASSGDP